MKFISVAELKTFISIMEINGLRVNDRERTEDYRKIFRYDNCLTRIRTDIEYIPQGMALVFVNGGGDTIKRIVFTKEK